MKLMTTKDLTEKLTLLIPQRQDDGEGGWQEEWHQGPSFWACLWPFLANKDKKATYQIILRAGIDLPPRIGFLWTLQPHPKRLLVISPPVFIQRNQFLCMFGEEDSDA